MAVICDGAEQDGSPAVCAEACYRQILRYMQISNHHANPAALMMAIEMAIGRTSTASGASVAYVEWGAGLRFLGVGAIELHARLDGRFQRLGPIPTSYRLGLSSVDLVNVDLPILPDTVLMASDGLWRCLPIGAIYSALDSGARGEDLVELARQERGYLRDDIALLLIRRGI